MYSIVLTLTLFQSEINLYWVCLYSEEKLDAMERNLKIETLSTGVKMVDYKQFSPNRRYAIYY